MNLLTKLPALNRRSCFVLIACLAFAGCNNTNAKEPTRMKELLDSLGPMRTHCIGRYLIDLPDALEISPHSDVELIYGLDKNFKIAKVQVPERSGGAKAYRSLVLSRNAELRRDESFKSPSKTMLAYSREIEPGLNVIRAYESPDSIEYFRAGLYALKGNTTVVLTKKVYDDDRPEDIESELLHINQGIAAPEDFGKAGPGACLGPAVIDAGQDGERFNVFWLNKRWPDFSFTIYINSLLAESDGGLLARFGRKSGDLARLGAKFDTIRKGKLTVGGRTAEELLTEGVEHGKVERQFKAEIPVTVPATFAAPFITFEMVMGGAKNANGEALDPSLTQEQAIALWDAVLKSVRPRPGAIAGIAPAR